jgi:hypothetical protein
MPLPTGLPGTNVTLFEGSGPINLALLFGAAYADGNINVIPTPACGHDSNCVFNNYLDQLAG